MGDLGSPQERCLIDDEDGLAPWTVIVGGERWKHVLVKGSVIDVPPVRGEMIPGVLGGRCHDQSHGVGKATGHDVRGSDCCCQNRCRPVHDARVIARSFSFPFPCRVRIQASLGLMDWHFSYWDCRL